jgi:quinol monooxygenase YgiN
MKRTSLALSVVLVLTLSSLARAERDAAHHGKKTGDTVHIGLLIRLEAKPGREADLAAFLESGASLVMEEAQTKIWYALKIGPSTYGIFDAFADAAGEQAHLDGRLAAQLGAKAAELLASPPKIEKVEVLAAKMPR